MDDHTVTTAEAQLLTFDTLYHTALLAIAERIQSRRFIPRKVYITTKKRKGHIGIPDIIETPRMKAVCRLRKTLMHMLSENVTPQAILDGIDQKMVAKGMNLGYEALRTVIITGCKQIAEDKQNELASALIDQGVHQDVAHSIAVLIITRRAECIKYLNESDDTGLDLIALPAPSS